MILRIVIVALIATGLMGLVIYSQSRPAASYVSGLIEAKEIRLGSRVGGRVKTVFVDEGDPIAAENRLIEFEAYDLLEREHQAVAVLAQRQAALERMNRGMRAEEIAQAKSRHKQAVSQLSLIKAGPREEAISAAENRVNSAIAFEQLANRENERITGLFQRDAVSKSEFDIATEKLAAASTSLAVRRDELHILQAGARLQEIEIAEAKVEDSRLAWELAKQGFRAEDIEQATAARDAAQSALGAIRKQRQELIIVAPTAGTIDSLDLQPGDIVGPNAPVMTMLSNQKLWVRAYVPQRLLQIHVGQKMRITLDSFPAEEFTGTITFISRQSEFTPSNVQTPDDRARQVYRIRVTLPVNARFRPGMTANVWLDPMDPAR